MKQPKLLWILGALLIGLVIITSLPVSAGHAPNNYFNTPAQLAPTPQSGNAGNVRIGEPLVATSFDGSLRDLPQMRTPLDSNAAPKFVPRHVPARPRAPITSAASDPVVQASFGKARMPTPEQSFDGLGYTGYYPPDPNGDVGPNHYIQAVNISFAIYNKSGALLAATSFNNFFFNASFNDPCRKNSVRGDPIVIYDAISGRWLLSAFAFFDDLNGLPAAPFYECIAISKTADPVNGGWWQYVLLADNTFMNDYPKFGVWSDGIYMAASMWSNSAFQFSRVWAFDRTGLINGGPVQIVSFNVPGGSAYPVLLPSNLRGTTMPPAGTPSFFASIDEPNILHLWKFHVDWNTPANSTFTGPTNLITASFTMPCGAASFDCVPQAGGTTLDALGDRLMMQLQYRNISGIESLWVNHTVAAGSGNGYPTGIRWYEIRNPSGTPFIYQQGTFQPDTNYRWMGSLAVDGQGNMALGYSVSSATLYPGIRYTGRNATDPLGALCLGEATLIDGGGAQTVTGRWGDYSAMTIDPTDDLTFWYTNQYYANSGGSWKTRIGSFKIQSVSQNIPRPFIYYFPVIGKAENLCY